METKKTENDIQELLIVLNGIEIKRRHRNKRSVHLLIVLNGIEIQMDNTKNRKTNAFNRTKWN